LKNHICFSHGVQVAGASWWVAMRIVVEVEDLVQRTDDDYMGRVLGGRTIRRSGNTVCDLHRTHEDNEHEFLG
jgi:hypothetical protein